MNDPIGDMLTRIRNAQMRGKSTVRPRPPSSAHPRSGCAGRRRLHPRLRAHDRQGPHPAFEISLKYYEGTPVIRELKRVSKPGRRVYLGVSDIPQVRQGLGVSIVSTSKGVMSDARRAPGQCRRRSALHGILRRANVSYR
jgi:small subunit ribosomal protein S8